MRVGEREAVEYHANRREHKEVPWRKKGADVCEGVSIDK